MQTGIKHIIQGLAKCCSLSRLIAMAVGMLSIAASVVAQTPQVQFDAVGAEDGMSEANILCIFQDSRGFMWFGTSNGLKKYDGYTFTTYASGTANSGSLSNNFVQDIAEDAYG